MKEKIEILKGFLQVVLLAGLVLLLITNSTGLNNFVSRIFKTADEVTIANVTIKFLPISVPTSTDASHVSQWIVSERANAGLEIKGAYFDEKENGYEYLEILATEGISLKNGFIGDENELLSLGESAPKLEPGDVIRIYTHINDSARKLITLDAYNIEATLPNGERTSKGVYKRRVGKGDRIMIFDTNNTIALDINFWWKSK